MNPIDPSRITSSSIPRRTFLKGVLAASAVSCLPGLRRLSSAVSPNEKLNLACCGIGNRGAEVINSFISTGMVNIVAFCDVDMGAPHTLKMLKAFPNVPRFVDFREMFDKMGKQIDVVTAAVPDHSHFPIVMQAMALGKHVYVEKPMAHTFQQIELMMAAEKKYKVAAQMGNQGHSEGNYFQFKAWREAGIIQGVTRITAYMNGKRRWHGWNITGFPEGETLPATLDWDKWLASAPYHPFSAKLAPGNWRSWFEYGNGALGDWGAHILDTAHQFLDLGLPEEVEAVKLDGHNAFIFPQASTLAFRFPARGSEPPVEVSWYDGVANLPPLPSNYGGAVYSADVPPPSAGSTQTKMPPGKVIYGKDLTFKGGSHGSVLKIVPEAKEKEMASRLPEYPKKQSSHAKNLLLAAKGEEKCRSSFAVAGPLCQMMALGVIAQRVNAKFKFDRQTKRVLNHEVADALLVGPPPRKGWEQYYKL